jgi:hypothetical protein
VSDWFIRWLKKEKKKRWIATCWLRLVVPTRAVIKNCE